MSYQNCLKFKYIKTNFAVISLTSSKQDIQDKTMRATQVGQMYLEKHVGLQEVLSSGDLEVGD